MEYNELYHHGIKGQKWGVRRYQNEDGSLTKAGKARQYGYTKKELNKEIKDAKKKWYKDSSKDEWEIGSTGKNWKDVYNDNKSAVKNDSKIRSLEKQKLEEFETYKMARANNVYVRSNYGVVPLAELSAAKINEFDAQIDKRAIEIGKTYSEKYSEALLKDIGYKNLELGKQMLNDYGVNNKYGKY